MHSYVVAAYGRSPHLEGCLASLREQSDSVTVVSTSTPFDGLERIAEENGASVVRHGDGSGIGADWNAAFAAASTPFVTIAHQDDVYAPDHAKRVLRAYSRYPDALLAMADYSEIDDNGPRPRNRTLLVKSMQRELAFLGVNAIGRTWRKRLLVRFGNSVPCPAVTFNKKVIPDFRFRTDMRTNLDWAAWIELASQNGKFLYVRRPLVQHRIHMGSETTACIVEGVRGKEDMELFKMLWPSPIAYVLARFYALSYGTNER